MQPGKKLDLMQLLVLWSSDTCLLCNNKSELGMKGKGKVAGKESAGFFNC